jgi:hypothetical protein
VAGRGCPSVDPIWAIRKLVALLSLKSSTEFDIMPLWKVYGFSATLLAAILIAIFGILYAQKGTGSQSLMMPETLQAPAAQAVPALQAPSPPVEKPDQDDPASLPTGTAGTGGAMVR